MKGADPAAGWAERVRALAAGQLAPAVPRPAATVLLLRDAVPGGPPGPEVHLLRRRGSMAFAGGMYAYPGGGVDPRDERPVGWAGPPLERWAALLGLPEARAQAVVCAAVRETFEEAGVLLAGPGTGQGSGPGAGTAPGHGTVAGALPGRVAGDTSGAAWEADRAALVAHELGFADLLARRGLVLRSDLLAPWARWVTPEFEERRYDTWFFLAVLPPGQDARDVSGEADRTVWLRPADALAGHARGELAMLPPTRATLRALLPYGSAAEALAAAPGRDLAPVLARADLDGDGRVVLTWPGRDDLGREVR
ncbi:NUDIX hydrolase [Actinacidiphila yeochonensis]|uniref:NUDIX hydrolase n=1 Tax=Actinacidiphila yeochonensis TaxID=89050 RepID=UPI000A56BFCE